MTRTLTGFQPTGTLHLGNLLGAMRPLVDAQDRSHPIALIADLHALTREHHPAEVRARTLEQATVLLGPLRERYRALAADPAYVESVLAGGAARVAGATATKVHQAKHALGLAA